MVGYDFDSGHSFIYMSVIVGARNRDNDKTKFNEKQKQEDLQSSAIQTFSRNLKIGFYLFYFKIKKYTFLKIYNEYLKVD